MYPTYIALPHMLAVRVHFVVKSVEYRNLRPRCFVDPVHMSLKERAVVIMIPHGRRHEDVRVDHFMLNRRKKPNHVTTQTCPVKTTSSRQPTSKVLTRSLRGRNFNSGSLRENSRNHSSK